MSTRIRTDGRRYNRETDLPPRPYHKPVASDEGTRSWGKCGVCGAPWGWVYIHKRVMWYMRHFPGTFWEQD